MTLFDTMFLYLFAGKLEALSILLQKLSVENRRVLIFTQMASMLDILEAFLDHRLLTYVRLDESLSVEERQVRDLEQYILFLLSVALAKSWSC